MTITNWNSTASCKPARVVAARDLPHLIAIVKDSDGTPCPSPLRAAGSLHSLNPCFTTDGTLVDMKTEAFKHIGTPEHGSITVGAGVTMIELRDALTPHGVQIEVVPEIGNATAGSVACCGTKDASLGPTGLGQISSTVIGVGMVDAHGSVVHVTDPQRLREIRSSYGLLGIVFEVTFKTISRRKLRYTYAPLDVTPDLTIEAVLGGASGFLGFLMPYHRKLVVERRTLDPRTDEKSPVKFLLDPIKRWTRDRAWEHIGTTAKGPTERREWLPGLDETLETFLTGIDTFDAWAGASMIDFKPKEAAIDFGVWALQAHAFDFAFWAFPVSGWKETLADYLTFCQDFQATTKFRSALPTEIYFIRKDDSALLSFCPDEDIFTLDLVDVVPRRSPEDEDLWQEMNEKFNEFAARHGARPLLNQTKFLCPDHMTMLNEHYKKRWADFATLRKEKDPEGRFLTPYFENLLAALPG